MWTNKIWLYLYDHKQTDATGGSSGALCWWEVGFGTTSPQVINYKQIIMLGFCRRCHELRFCFPPLVLLKNRLKIAGTMGSYENKAVVARWMMQAGRLELEPLWLNKRDDGSDAGAILVHRVTERLPETHHAANWTKTTLARCTSSDLQTD